MEFSQVIAKSTTFGSSINRPLVKEIYQFKMDNYDGLIMFNKVESPWKRYTKLKFMSDLVFLKYGLEDESMLLQDYDGIKHRESFVLNG